MLKVNLCMNLVIFLKIKPGVIRFPLNGLHMKSFNEQGTNSASDAFVNFMKAKVVQYVYSCCINSTLKIALPDF